MRLRNIPRAESTLQAHELVIKHPEEQKGKWCSLFGNSNPIEIEIGMGIHGEKGIETTKIKTAKEIAEILVGRILDDYDYSGSEVAVLVNGLGGTPLMELYILNMEVQKILEEKGIKAYRTFVGNYCTSMDMTGASVTLMKLDDELKELLDAPCDTPALKI